MVQRVEIQFTDDLDGSPADGTVTFAVDGTSYEIDLSTVHADEFRQSLQPFVEAARRVNQAARRGPAKGGNSGQPSPSAVREWARSEGLTVSDRGRVPAELVTRFQEATR